MGEIVGYHCIVTKNISLNCNTAPFEYIYVLVLKRVNFGSSMKVQPCENEKLLTVINLYLNISAF